MKKKASKAQMAGVKAFQEQRSAENIAKANAAIDKLYRQGKEVNFEAVAKESGVSRTGLYGNPKIRDRVLKLRTKCRSAPNSDYTVIKKSDKEEYERQIADYRAKVKQLEQDKLNLINQLVELEDLREEVSRLKSRLIEVNKKE